MGYYDNDYQDRKVVSDRCAFKGCPNPCVPGHKDCAGHRRDTLARTGSPRRTIEIARTGSPRRTIEIKDCTECPYSRDPRVRARGWVMAELEREAARQLRRHIAGCEYCQGPWDGCEEGQVLELFVDAAGSSKAAGPGCSHPDMAVFRKGGHGKPPAECPLREQPMSLSVNRQGGSKP
jgi:hypothetical protein